MTPDSDSDLLDDYLDHALAPQDAERLRHRLATDAGLVVALDHVRRDRALRQRAFATLAPDDAAVDTLVRRIREVTTHAPRPAAAAGWSRPLRLTAAAAACVAAGFFARGLLDHPQLTPDQANVNPIHHPTGVDLRKVDTYQVTLRDDAGKVLAVQRFDSLDKAQEFAADLARWQAGTERLASNQFVVTTDRF